MSGDAQHLFLVEDHPIMREAMALLIDPQPDLAICGVAESAEEALERLPAGADLVLVDVSLPGMNGLELVRRIRTQWPELACLVISGHSAARYEKPALAAGAAGYVMKDDADAVISAIRAALPEPAGAGAPHRAS